MALINVAISAIPMYANRAVLNTRLHSASSPAPIARATYRVAAEVRPRSSSPGWLYARMLTTDFPLDLNHACSLVTGAYDILLIVLLFQVHSGMVVQMRDHKTILTR